MSASVTSWDAPASPDPSPASPDPEPGSNSEYMPWKSIHVDIPCRYFPYRPNSTSNLPTLLETVLVPVRDPRLVKDLPNDSVYQIIRKFFSSKLAAALNCDRTRDPRLKERLILVNNKSDVSSGEEDWYHEKIEGKPRRLKIHIHLKRLKWLGQTCHSEHSSQVVYNIAELGQSPERIDCEQTIKPELPELHNEQSNTANRYVSKEKNSSTEDDKTDCKISEKPMDSKTEQRATNETEPKTEISSRHSEEKISSTLETERHKKHKKQKKQKKVKHRKKRSPSPSPVNKEKIDGHKQKLDIESPKIKMQDLSSEKSFSKHVEEMPLPVPKPETLTMEKIPQPIEPPLIDIAKNGAKVTSSEKVATKALNIKDLKAATELVKKRIQISESAIPKPGESCNQTVEHFAKQKTPGKKVELVAYPKMYQDPRLREKMKTVEPVPAFVAETTVKAQSSLSQEKEESGVQNRDPRLVSKQRSVERKQKSVDKKNLETEAAAKRKFQEVKKETREATNQEKLIESTSEQPPSNHKEKRLGKASKSHLSSKEPSKEIIESTSEQPPSNHKEKRLGKASKSHLSSKEPSKETIPPEPSNVEVKMNSTKVCEVIPTKLPEKSASPCLTSQSSGLFRPLSGFVQKMCGKVDPKINDRIDILVKSTQDKVTDSLDKVSRGKHCDALEYSPKFSHFPSLSLPTQLESSMLSYPSIQKIVSEEMMLWMREKPLDMYMLGKPTEHFKFTNNNNIIKASPRTDETVNQALDEFNANVYELMKEQNGSDKALKRSNNGLPKPKCKTDETVHQVYRQVTQYLDFLASKELSTKSSENLAIASTVFGADKLNDTSKDVKVKKEETNTRVENKEGKKERSKKEKHKKKDKEIGRKEDKEKNSKEKDPKDKDGQKERFVSSGAKLEEKFKKEDTFRSNSNKKGRWDSNSKLSSDKKSSTDDSSKAKILHVTTTVKKSDKPKVTISLYDPHDPTDDEDSSGKPGSPIPYQLKTVPDVVKSRSHTATKSSALAAENKDKDHKSRKSRKAVFTEPKIKIDINQARSKVKDASETVVLDPLAETLAPNFDPFFDVRNLKVADVEEKNPWDISHYYQRKYKEYVKYINERKFPSKEEMSIEESEGNFAFAYMKSLAQGKMANLTKPTSISNELKSGPSDDEVNEYGTNVNEYGSFVLELNTNKSTNVPGLQPGLGELKLPDNPADFKDKNTENLSVVSDNTDKTASSPKSPRGFEPVAMSAKDKVSIAPKIKLVVSSASKIKTTSTTSTSSTVKSNTKPKIAKSGNWLVRSFQQAVQAKQKLDESSVASKANDKGRLSALQKMKLNQQSKKEVKKSADSKQMELLGEPEAKKCLLSTEYSIENVTSSVEIASSDTSATSEPRRTLFRHTFKREASNEISPPKKPKLVSADYVPPPPADISQQEESPKEDIDLSEVLEMTIERSPVRIESITQEVPEQPPPPEPEPDGRTTPVMDDIPLPPAGGLVSIPDATTAILQAQAITYSQDAQQFYGQHATTTASAAVTYPNQEQTTKLAEQTGNGGFGYQPDIPQPDESYSQIAQQAQEWSQWQAAQQAGHHQPNWQWDSVSQRWVDYNAYYSQWNPPPNYNCMPPPYHDGSHYPPQWPTHPPPQSGWEGWNQPPPQPTNQINTMNTTVAESAPGTEPIVTTTTEEETYDENAEEGYTTGTMTEQREEKDKLQKEEHQETYSQYYYQQQQQSQPAFIPTQTNSDQEDHTQQNPSTPQQSGDVWRQPPPGNSTGQQNNFRGPPPPGVGLLPHPQQFRTPPPGNRFQTPFEPRVRPPFDPRFNPPQRFQGTWGMFRRVDLQPDEDPNQAPARHVRMYVFNKDQSICKSILRFLDFMGAKEFDPYNVQLLKALNDNEMMVYVHNQDIAILNNIPNLLRLKENPKVKFVAYENVFDVKQKKYSPILLRGGIVVPDDQIILEISAENLQTICEFMESKKLKDEPWVLKLNESVNLRLDEMIKTSKEENKERLEKVKKLLDEYKDKQIVETLISEQEPVVKPAPEYMNILINLQASQAFHYRHIFFLTNMPAACIEASALQAQGISVVNPSCFITCVTDKEPVRDMKPQFFNYGLRGSPMFSDLYRSSAIDTINVDLGELMRHKTMEPHFSQENVEMSQSSSQLPAPPPPLMEMSPS